MAELWSYAIPQLRNSATVNFHNPGEARLIQLSSGTTEAIVQRAGAAVDLSKLPYVASRTAGKRRKLCLKQYSRC